MLVQSLQQPVDVVDVLVTAVFPNLRGSENGARETPVVAPDRRIVALPTLGDRRAT